MADEIVRNKRKARCSRCKCELQPGEGIGWENFHGYGVSGYGYFCEKCNEIHKENWSKTKIEIDLALQEGLRITNWKKLKTYRDMIDQFKRQNGRDPTNQEKIDLLKNFEPEEWPVET